MRVIWRTRPRANMLGTTAARPGYVWPNREQIAVRSCRAAAPASATDAAQRRNQRAGARGDTNSHGRAASHSRRSSIC